MQGKAARTQTLKESCSFAKKMHGIGQTIDGHGVAQLQLLPFLPIDSKVAICGTLQIWNRHSVSPGKTMGEIVLRKGQMGVMATASIEGCSSEPPAETL